MRLKSILFLFAIIVLAVAAACSGKEEKPNILLITVDTLRRDHLSVMGYPRPTSPFIDKLANNGMMFSYVITPIPLTCGSHSSILTSLHPLTHGVRLNSTNLSSKVVTIAEILKTNGYYTTAAVGSTLLKGDRGFSQGFDSYSDTWEPGKDNTSKYQRPANDVQQSLIKQIDAYLEHPKQSKKPLFMWIHYYDPHTPYYGKDHIRFEKGNENETGRYPPYLKKILKDKRIEKYDEEIRYTDEHIEKLMEYLEMKKISRNMVMAITADHGEEFGEHGHKYSHSNFYSETTMVPLILFGKKIPRGIAIDTYISTMDIPVTLLRTANLSFPGPVEGIDLLDAFRKKAFKANKKFLVVGNPKYNRSIQLMSEDRALIVNFDHHQRYWYMLGYCSEPGNESLFTSLPEGRVVRSNHSLTLQPPDCRRKGLNFLILRVSVKQNNGIAVRLSLGHTIQTTRESFPANKNVNVVEIVYPVTILDTITAKLWEEKGTVLENPGYAIVPADLFHWPPEKNYGYVGKVVNKVFISLKAPRKHVPDDELYDLKNDFIMSLNLIDKPHFKPLIIDYKKLIYSAHAYYYRKGMRLLKGIKQKENLSKEEIQMLKSLGYL